MRWKVELTYHSGSRVVSHDAVVVQETAIEAVEYAMMRFLVKHDDLVQATVRLAGDDE